MIVRIFLTLPASGAVPHPPHGSPEGIVDLLDTVGSIPLFYRQISLISFIEINP
jgi:hypothetical protein